MEPYAVTLLRRFQAGESVKELAESEGIPWDRVLIRLEAARNYLRAWQEAEPGARQPIRVFIAT